MVGHFELKANLIDGLLENSELAFEELVERQSQSHQREKIEKKMQVAINRLQAFSDSQVNTRFSNIIQMMNAKTNEQRDRSNAL